MWKPRKSLWKVPFSVTFGLQRSPNRSAGGCRSRKAFSGESTAGGGDFVQLSRDQYTVCDNQRKHSPMPTGGAGDNPFFRHAFWQKSSGEGPLPPPPPNTQHLKPRSPIGACAPHTLETARSDSVTSASGFGPGFEVSQTMPRCNETVTDALLTRWCAHGLTELRSRADRWYGGRGQRDTRCYNGCCD